MKDQDEKILLLSKINLVKIKGSMNKENSFSIENIFKPEELYVLDNFTVNKLHEIAQEKK